MTCVSGANKKSGPRKYDSTFGIHTKLRFLLHGSFFRVLKGSEIGDSPVASTNPVFLCSKILVQYSKLLIASVIGP